MIRSVLRAFDQERTRVWFDSLGVPLKLESTGKYFPMSDSALTVLDALLRRVEELGIELRTGARVLEIHPPSDDSTVFRIVIDDAPDLAARRIVLATGGMALPKSGSDGAGFEFARQLGHAMIPITPALCPLVLPPGPLRELSGITIHARLGLIDAAGRHLFETTDSLLITHFGLSGPAAMNLSRHLLRARLDNPNEKYRLALGHPDFPTAESADAWLQAQAKSSPRADLASALGRLWPARLAQLLAGENPVPLGKLTREARRMLARELAGMPLAVEGARGWSFAETTAGGVDLREIDPRTMQSRIVPGLYLCGEILDVDGRIGGFSFQWAWSGGWLAGRAAVASLDSD
jgi:predicted Rossmann fold flavoprotein